ncbi:hypothetical protein [Microbacterium testaceum]|uniref:hypothetical protein n=1 Tax=Microbacterium testaceum TaxID=2033 RepID=UPI000945105A|nr:hypothetical protein [Microbacterium testaceum]
MTGGSTLERPREALSALYPIPRQTNVHLGRLYVTDECFAAEWLRDATEASDRALGVVPATAEWA